MHFLHTPTGEAIPVINSVFPLRDGSGAVTALATITRDLRAQKAAEAERTRLLLNEREARAQGASRICSSHVAHLITIDPTCRSPFDQRLSSPC